MTNAYLPIVFAFVLGLCFLLLAVAFRSLVVPAKAIVMNLLSVGAAYGLLVLVFQKGIGAELLGFQQVEAIEAWLPLFLFSVLFGLSMDYHVFLLTRIREHYDQTGDNRGAIEFGVASTGRIITGAALIMVAVFGGFAAGELVMFQQMGFGLGVAVLLDATIVRSVLVPATMRLLGDRNWYLPRWLELAARPARRGGRAEPLIEPARECARPDVWEDPPSVGAGYIRPLQFPHARDGARRTGPRSARGPAAGPGCRPGPGAAAGRRLRRVPDRPPRRRRRADRAEAAARPGPPDRRSGRGGRCRRRGRAGRAGRRPVARLDVRGVPVLPLGAREPLRSGALHRLPARRRLRRAARSPMPATASGSRRTTPTSRRRRSSAPG